MNNYRKYGEKPFKIIVIHGGPGAIGDMKPVAKELSDEYGVIEYLQTAETIDGQVEELHNIVKNNSDKPLILIGHSWGAWLAYIYTSRYLNNIKKLILVGSGPFKDEYASQIMETRLHRMDKDERKEFDRLIRELHSDDSGSKEMIISRFGELMIKSDSFNPIPKENNIIEVNMEIYRKVWKEAEKMRKNGELLEIGKKINCSVTAIHGEYDPHPSEGVREPLSKIIEDFHIILLEKCGHKPWIEKEAKNTFYEVLRKELSTV